MNENGKDGRGNPNKDLSAGKWYNSLISSRHDNHDTTIKCTRNSENSHVYAIPLKNDLTLIQGSKRPSDDAEKDRMIKSSNALGAAVMI